MSKNPGNCTSNVFIFVGVGLSSCCPFALLGSFKSKQVNNWAQIPIQGPTDCHGLHNYSFNDHFFFLTRKVYRETN